MTEHLEEKSSQARTNVVEDTRAEVVNYVLIALSVILIPGLLFSVFRTTETGWLPLNSIHIGVAVAMWAVTAARTHLPYAIRAGTIVCLFMLLGIASTMTFGPSNGGPAFAAAVILCAVFFERRLLILAAASAVFFLGGIFALSTGGIIAWPLISPSPQDAGTWLTLLAGFALISVGPILAIAKFKLRAERDRIRLVRQAWALKAYGQAALALSQAKSSQEVADLVCEALVQENVYTLALMALAESGPDKPVRIVSAAGPALGYADGLLLSWLEQIPAGNGSTGRAIRAGAPIVIEDMQNDPSFAPWRARAASHGLRSSTTIPFQRKGALPGAFLIYASSPNAFGPEEIELFTNLAKAISFAFDAYADRARLDAETLRLQRLIDAAYNPIISVTAEGKIAVFNHAAQSAFGYCLEEVLDQPLDILIPTAQAEMHREQVQGFLTGSETSRQMAAKREVFGRRKNGEVFPLEVAITRVENFDGPFSTAIVNDLTERRAFEQRLVQSAKMEAFGLLSGRIAHDFNNILAVIVTYTELLRDNVEAGSEDDLALRRIDSAATRGADLVRRMMSVAGRDVGTLDAINICALLEDLIAIIKAGFGKGISVSFQRPSGDLFARVNRAELHTSLLNLAFNARDAMADGGSLEISMAREMVEGTGWIEIRIADTGSGIAPEALTQIFEPFYTSKAPGKGTGLGLAMVKRFVEDSGGEILVSSAVDKGTTFIMRLPEYAAGCAR